MWSLLIVSRQKRSNTDERELDDGTFAGMYLEESSDLRVVDEFCFLEIDELFDLLELNWEERCRANAQARPEWPLKKPVLLAP